MKSFFALCATLSVIQVIFIDESIAQVDDYQDYTPYNNRVDRRTTTPQYDRQFTRQPPAAGRRLDPEMYYDRNGPLNRSLPRTRSNMREPQYPQISPRFNNYGYGRGYTQMEQQPITRNGGSSILGNLLRIPADLVENVGSLVGNKVLNVSKIANHGMTKLTDLGNGITDGIMNTMDSFGNVANGALNTGAEIPRRLTNMSSFNNYNQYQDGLSEEYIPYNNNIDEYYDPYAQQPVPLPQRRIPMRGNEVENIPARNNKRPSQLTSEQLPENAKEVVTPLTPAKKEQKLTPVQTPAIDQTPIIEGENAELA